MKSNIKDYSFNYDKNWYLNPENIPNHKLVFETIDYLESVNIEPFEFLNLMYKQYQELSLFKGKPFDYIEHLKQIPIDNSYYTNLIGCIFKWFGGSGQFDENIEIILRLLYKEIQKNLSQPSKENSLFFIFINNSVMAEKYKNTMFKLYDFYEEMENKQPQNDNNLQAKIEQEAQLEFEPIKWQKESVILAFLINELKTYGFIEDINIWANCEKIFIDKKGKPIKAETFTSMVKNYEGNKTFDGISKGKPKKSEEISTLIETLKTISKAMQ